MTIDIESFLDCDLLSLEDYYQNCFVSGVIVADQEFADELLGVFEELGYAHRLYALLLLWELRPMQALKIAIRELASGNACVVSNAVNIISYAPSEWLRDEDRVAIASVPDLPMVAEHPASGLVVRCGTTGGLLQTLL